MKNLFQNGSKCVQCAYFAFESACARIKLATFYGPIRIAGIFIENCYDLYN